MQSVGKLPTSVAVAPKQVGGSSRPAPPPSPATHLGTLRFPSAHLPLRNTPVLSCLRGERHPAVVANAC